MILADVMESEPCLQWQLEKQMGVNHAVIGFPTNDMDQLTDYDYIQRIVDRYLEADIKPCVVEGMPECIHRHIKAGDDLRGKALDIACRFIENLGKADVRVICPNFMTPLGWYRTDMNLTTRGGAFVTGFDYDKANKLPPMEDGISQEKLWENIEIFLKTIAPTAEAAGVQIGMHPDDPPVPQLIGNGRILTSMANIQKAISLVDSPNIGITLCQGSYATMGEDISEVIEWFGSRKKIFFVHFRDVVGDRYHFQETFHDDGKTDMAQAIQMYKKVGYHGPVRVDHVPTMAGEDNSRPSYMMLGRLFATGYLMGLLDASGYEYV